VPIALRPLCYLLALAAALMSTPARGAVETQGGIGFVAVTGATPGTVMVLDDPHHTEVGRGTVDRLGSLLFRYLASGPGYVVHDSAAGGFVSDPISVRTFDDVPDQSFYTGQTLTAGFQYIRARDGTLLAAMVRLPAGPGPFPTVVEYSGYAAADPDSPQASTLIASVLGFATVGVNMRGSGCSGGVIDLFDYPTTADGYDVIETVAAQSWAKGGKAGMIGISFPGISQLFVGGARPPHLAAIAPLSVIADIYRSPGFPGGIFNSGFAQSWLEERNSDAQPAPDGGQSYAIKRVNDGDATCLANQRLRLQTLDAVQFTESHPYYVPSLMDQRSPINWVAKIKVPTFLASAFQDEQTGGDFASMLSRLPHRRDVKITVANGVHTTSLDPVNLWNWLAFLDIYVAGEVPNQVPLAGIAPVIYGMILGNGAPTPPLPPNRFAGVTSLKDAKRMFESDPHVRVLMENGAGSSTAGLPAATFQLALRQWPAPQLHPTAWYFGPGGTLTPKRPTATTGGVDGFHPDPAARPQQTLPGQDQEQSWLVLPDYDWRPLVDGTAVAYATPPLDHDVVIAGPSSVDLWLRSSATDTDVQVTLTEIRPDGKETYVQNGWLRASHRKLDSKRSTLLEPRPTHLEADAAPLPAGTFSKVRVGLFSVAHVFRAGSHIRISVEAPGGDRTRWDFDTPATSGGVLDELSRTPAQPSRLVLPVLPGVSAPPALPPCPGLRGQPCRDYAPATNGG
jgi:predicted acyl esterase